MKHLFLVLLAFAAMSAAPATARESTLLDTGWRFKSGAIADAEKNTFNDRDWQALSLPHNWGCQDAEAGKDYYRGPGWYRRELKINAQAGKRFFLRFEAASQVAVVYVNGKRIGEHRGAFGAFSFEITQALSPTGTNLLAVCVDNSKQPDVAPLGGDFSIYGGLYRPVHLIETSEYNISPVDHGSSGVTWLQTNITKEQAVIDVTAQISNGTKTKQSLTLVTSLFNATGTRVATNTETIAMSADCTAPYFVRLTVPQPHLWNGRTDPYLYKAVVELQSNNGVIDSIEQPLGLRFYSIDPEKGFFLNGQPYHLHGVNRHQDMAVKGWAISEADQDGDIAMLLEMGATAVRCCHYQHSDYFYSLCDRAGILVWAELPQVNTVHDTPEFENTSRNQLLDLIRQNINHPSIFAWSLYNEISYGDDPHRNLLDLDLVAHGEDPTRPTIAATLGDGRPQINKIPDLLGWNIYPGWYWGDPKNYGGELDKRKTSSRNGGFCLSEYGAGANTLQHEQPAKRPPTKGPWHPEEWQAEVHEAAWAAIKTRPFVWGSFVWCMFDFTVNTRHEGGQEALNDKGLVTRDRKTKKDAFYFYKANWSDKPMVYITSRRFIERTNAVTDVKIYSNAPEVELSVGGVAQGSQKNDGNGVFIWKNITLKPGSNQIDARATRDGKPVTDRCAWTLKS